MHAGIIWYRVRPSAAAAKKIEYMLAGIDCAMHSEETTIRPENIPALLADSLSRNTVTVIVGGMELLRERDNIIYILSSCLSLPIEEGRRSRSGYIYDTLRAVVLPTFEQAILFPSAVPEAPEAVLVTASGQAIIILPENDDAFEKSCSLIGDYLLGVRSDTEKKEEEEQIQQSPLPDYMERARRKRMAYLAQEKEEAEKRKSAADKKYELSERDIQLAMMHTTLAPENALLETNTAPPPKTKKVDPPAPKKTLAAAAAQRKAKRQEAERQSLEEKRREQERELALQKAKREQESLRFAPRTQTAKAQKRERAEARLRAAAPPPVSASVSSPVVAQLPETVPVKRTISYTARIRAGAIVLVFAIITGLCVTAFGFYESGIIETQAQYLSELRAMYTESGDEAQTALLPEGASSKFAALYSKNSQTAGYLEIAGTGISLPVMTSDYANPGYYDSHDFYGQDDSRGCLRFDEDNVISADAADPNIVIYGQNPSDGSVFSALENYLNRAYFIEHPVISMDTLYEQSDWLIFSVCIVSNDTVGAFNYADTSFTGAYTNEVFLYNLFIRSLFYTPVEVFPGDRLLTLVTDSDEFTGAKLVLCARRMREEDSLETFATGVIENELALMPDFWYELHQEQKPVVPRLELPTLFDISTQPADYFKTSTTTTTTTTTTATTSTTTTTTTATTSTVGDGTQPTTADTTTAATEPTTTATTLPPSTTVDNMRISSNGRIIDDTAVNVLAMIIEAEMGSGFEMEALKAQAVAAYTYYLYSGGRAKAPSFPTKTASSKCIEAAASVVGQYLTVNGHVPYSPYYATSAGMSANNADINGTALSYLVAVDCSVDANAPDYMTVKEVAASTVASKVKSAKGINLYEIADKTQWLRVLERDSNGLYVKQVQVGSKTYRGNTLHLSILGYSCLRSPCFWIEYNATNDTFIFTSYGYGTGVGMSQNGANLYARQGWNYAQILKHFYTGVSISS